MRPTAAIGLLLMCAMIGDGAYGTPMSGSAPRVFPVSIPFAVDAGGKSIAIPFDVRPGDMDAKHRFMIALDVPYGPDLPAVKDVRMNSRSMRVKVFYDDHGVRVPVETEDDDTVIARNRGRPLPHRDMSICRLDLYATLDDESHIAICGFYVKQFGHYVAEVSTIEPLPAFEGIATKLRVDKFYNTGE